MSGWRAHGSRSARGTRRRAERAVALLEESGHVWLGPLARFAAAGVAAARGEWAAATEHAQAAVARSGDYELMVVATGLARAQVPAARGDHDGVLRALEPLAGLPERVGVDEPGFWPWQDLYGDALVSAGRLDEAAAFLAPHEELAAVHGRGSMIASLARVRGRLEAARGHLPAAEVAFRRGLAEVWRRLWVPRTVSRPLIRVFMAGRPLRHCLDAAQHDR